MRAHPALLIPPLMILVCGALAFVLLTSVSIVYQQEPSGHGAAPSPSGHQAAGHVSQPGNRRTVVIIPVATDSPPPGRPHGRPPGQPSSPSPSPSSPSPSASPSPGPGGPTPVPTTPVPDPSPSSAPPPEPWPSPSPPNGGGTCVRVGPLGVCIDL